MTKEERREMMNTVDALECTCENCPFAEQCDKEELFWGCGVWEDMMGDDL